VNSLTKFIPPTLNHLEILDLSSNQLQNFDFLSDCPFMKKLNISNNKITRLPSCITNFANLTSLNIGYKIFILNILNLSLDEILFLRFMDWKDSQI